MDWRNSIVRATMLAVLLSAGEVIAQDPPSPHRAGFESSRITDSVRSRPIQIDVWYPTAADEAEHSYGLGAGRVAQKAPIASGRFPVVLLTHGALGAATNYSWISEQLARFGFVVVGVSHFGESPVFGQSTVDPATVGHFGARTRDLSFALDFALTRSKWAAAMDGERVGALGHSSGGAVMTMLAGGRYRPEAMAAHCRSREAERDRGCRYPVDASSESAAEPPTADPRVRALVLLDPAVGPGFDDVGLAPVKTRTLVIGSVDNDFMPFAFHAGRYARLLPNVDVIRLEKGEGHFVYLDECLLPIEAMGVRLCADRPGVVRREVHAALCNRIVDFFTQNLRTGVAAGK